MGTVCATASIDDTVNDPFAVYPNPAKDVVYLLNPNTVNIQKIVVTDVLGKAVVVQAGNGNQLMCSSFLRAYIYSKLKPARVPRCKN